VFHVINLCNSFYNVGQDALSTRVKGGFHWDYDLLPCLHLRAGVANKRKKKEYSKKEREPHMTMHGNWTEP
jgi:hypothetical protein